MVSISIAAYCATQKNEITIQNSLNRAISQVFAQKFKYANIQMHSRRFRSHIHILQL